MIGSEMFLPLGLLFGLIIGTTDGMAFLDSSFPFPISANLSRLRVADRLNADVVSQNNVKFRQYQIGLSDDDELRLAPDMERTGSSTCGNTITNLGTGDSGVIKSPQYPGNYPADAKCVWWLKAVDGLKISLTCTDVLTQSCDAGYYDYVLVAPDWAWAKYYLFQSSANSVLWEQAGKFVTIMKPDRLCGDYNKYTPFTLVSNENFLSVYFRSSFQQEYRGFQCRYEVVSEKTTSKPGVSEVTTPSTTTPKPNALSYNGEEGCGIPNTKERIVGGTQVTPHRYPWMAGLSFNGQWFCGGTIINKEWILTAAHCTHGASSSYVYLGAHNLYNEEAGRLIIATKDFVPHPQYDSQKITNDVALVRLPKGAVKEYTENIRPVCLPTRSIKDADVANHPFHAVGWGKTETSATISPVLNELSVRLVTNEVCTKSYGDIIKASNVCAQGQNGTGTCQGDSGSSLQYAPKNGLVIQYGVVSFGASTGCGTGYPNGYSRLSSYLDFIGQTIGQTLN